MLSLQPSGIERTELDAPQADCFSADGDAPFGEEVFNIPMAQIEPVVEPDGVGNYIWRESVAHINIHQPILSTWASYVGDTAWRS